jgi:glycosyltransferase involved in cell wall biosynthesis
MLAEVTPLIITYNEAPNIDRTLQQLKWAKEIIIIDSFSTDKTLDITSSYSQVKVIQHPFESFASQCNFGLSKVKTDWVLSLDADYILSQELIDEIASLSDTFEIDAYSVYFKYCVYGKSLRSTVYPDRKVLYKKNKAIYESDGHAHRVKIDGTIRSLSHCIYHDDRKPVIRWFNAEIKYAELEMKKLLNLPLEELSFVDRIRLKKIIAPFLMPIYCLIYKGGILDGWHGIYYASQRMLAELLLSIKLIENKFQTAQSKKQ